MRRISRRDFIRLTGRAGLMGPVVGSLGASPLLAACGSEADPVTPPGNDTNGGAGGRFALRLPQAVDADDLRLVAAPTEWDIGGGLRAPVWALNGEVPSPLIRIRRGERFRAVMENRVPQDLILHWHGLAPPDHMDGHPRFAVAPGGSYQYDFTVEDRAGTYWYHSHTHHHTGEHTYRGIAGLLLVQDDEEDSLGLPSGAREVPLILQDRRVDPLGVPFFEPFGPALMAGYMGTQAMGNGVRDPYLEVDTAVYRFRILNGSNARIFRLGFSDGTPFHLVGNDGGLLPAPERLTSVDVAPAERVDLLIDLRGHDAGERLMLRSLPFSLSGGMGFMGGQNLQGDPLALLELRVARVVDDATPIPTSLPPVALPDPADSVRERTFRFDSRQMNHFINGRRFEMERVDERVPFGETEIWSFVNESGLPHPVHLHATHFRVLSRTGGRGRVFPWEAGRKDTVLLQGFETVRVALRFTAHRGLYLLHCHNLEHEDLGMMANILVE